MKERGFWCLWCEDVQGKVLWELATEKLESMHCHKKTLLKQSK